MHVYQLAKRRRIDSSESESEYSESVTKKRVHAQIKSVKRNKIRVIGRVLMLIAALAQLYLLYVLDLNTSQGPIE